MESQYEDYQKNADVEIDKLNKVVQAKENELMNL